MTREKKQDLREQSLLKEFTKYRNSRKKQLTEFSREAIRVGFRKAWKEHDYTTIITVARKIPEDVLLGDALLCTWYDNAVIHSGGPLGVFF